ncbi:MAG: hypothetical protein CL477_16465 [Acidobacteria bacterium]|nr:hypothetical protein [Acidobacteriota bacterium]HJN46463.1 hypothetical protein [Vicinamibacterales bacterium]
MSSQELVVLVMRMLERILAVGIGGLTVYLGFRLFVLLPTQSTSEGKIELPGYSVVLSKVGPDVFFMAFGVFLLYQSFSMRIQVGENGFVGATSSIGSVPLLESASPEPLASPQQLARLQRNLQVLNCAKARLDTISGVLPEEEVVRAIRDAKLALLQDAWMTGLWGEQAAFVHWAHWNDGEVNSQALELYQGAMPGCAISPEGQ